MSLENFVSLVEKTHQIKFSYKTGNIDNQFVEIDTTESLVSLLESLRQQTSLFAQKIDERYYLLLNKEELGKITLCGIILDEFTKTPIEHATILNLSTNRKADTNAEGYFELYLASPNNGIRIIAAGYDSKKLIASYITGKPCPKVYLKGQGSQLDEVLITEYLKNDLDALGNQENISFNPNEIGTLPSLVEPDVFETLQILPGVQGASESASELLIRGGNPDQNLVLWDNIRLYNTSHLFGAFSIVNPYITENIELYRGDGINPKYGGALGSVISISSISKIPSKLTGSFGTTLNAADANIQVPLAENAAIVASARYSINSIFDNPIFDRYLTRITQNGRLISDFNSQQVFVNVDGETIIENTPEFGDFALKAIFSSDHDDFAISGLLSKNTLNVNRSFTGSLTSNDLGFDKTSYSYGIRWNHSYSNKLEHQLSVNRSHNSNSLSANLSTNDSRDIIGNRDFEDSFGKAFENLKDETANFSMRWSPNKKHTFDLGYNFNYISVDNNYFYGATNQRLSYGQGFNENSAHAVYSNVKMNLTDWLSLDLGIRVSQFSILDNDKLYWAPRSVMRLKLGNKLTGRLSYNKNNQVIHQLSFLYPLSSIEGNPWVLIDTDLYDDPIQGEQFGAGLRFDTRSFNVAIDIYQKKAININSGIRGFQQISGILLGDSETSGLDVLLKKRFGNFRTIFTYSYMNQFFFFDDINRNTQFPGNFDTTHSFGISQTFSSKNFEFSLGWNYRTGTPYTLSRVDADSDFRLSSTDLVNTLRLAPYHRLDFSTSYKFNLDKNDRWKSKVTLSLLNIYDRENEISALTETVDNTVEGIGVDPGNYVITTKSIGFTPNLGLRVSF